MNINTFLSTRNSYKADFLVEVAMETDNLNPKKVPASDKISLGLLKNCQFPNETSTGMYLLNVNLF